MSSHWTLGADGADSGSTTRRAAKVWRKVDIAVRGLGQPAGIDADDASKLTITMLMQFREPPFPFGPPRSYGSATEHPSGEGCGLAALGDVKSMRMGVFLLHSWGEAIEGS